MTSASSINSAPAEDESSRETGPKTIQSKGRSKGREAVWTRVLPVICGGIIAIRIQMASWAFTLQVLPDVY
jgi:hypothetical protein